MSMREAIAKHIDEAWNFLKLYFYVEISLSNFAEIIWRSLEARRPMLDYLGLWNPELRIEFEPVVVPPDHWIEAMGRICKQYLGKEYSREELILGREANGAKIWKKLRRKLPQPMFDLLLRKMQVHSKKNDNVRHYLSARPIDILAAGMFDWNVATSCFRPDGEYKYAPHVILQAGNTLIAYGLEGEDKKPWDKVWRTWVFFKNANEFYIGRKYGRVDDAILRGLRRYIEMRIDNAVLGRNRFWRIQYDKNVDYWITEGTLFERVYYDNASQVIYTQEAIDQQIWKRNLHSFEPLVVEADARCERCGIALTEDEVYYGPDDYPYCESCWDELFTFCCHCDYTGLREDMIEGPDGYLYCENCANELFDECEDCGDTVWREQMYYIDDGDYYVCEDCFERNYIVCEKCNQSFYKDNVERIGNSYYCSDCAEEIREEMEIVELEEVTNE